MKDCGHPETRGSRRMEIMVPMRLRYSSTRIVVNSNTSCKHIQETSYPLYPFVRDMEWKNAHKMFITGLLQTDSIIKCKLVFEFSIL